MRVISQKSLGYTSDIPYEQVSIEVRANNIYVLCDATGGSGRLIACYSTPEKAEKALEMLWDAESSFDVFVFRFPEDSEVRHEID